MELLWFPLLNVPDTTYEQASRLDGGSIAQRTVATGGEFTI
jgi:hypothetical protein